MARCLVWWSAAAAITVGCSPSVSQGPAPAEPSAVLSTATPATACAVPVERPAYLPPGFAPDPSIQSTVPGLGAEGAQRSETRRLLLVWEGSNGEYVLLSAADGSPFLNEPQWERVQLRGHTGVFVWVGDPSVGPLSLIWPERPGRCGVYELTARLRRVPGGAAADLRAATLAFQREAARIAESLR